MDCIRGVRHMLYRRLKRKKIHINTYPTYHKPLPRGQRIVLFILFYILLLFAAVSFILIQLKPLMLKLAKTMVTDVLLIQVNDVIEQEILKGTFDYTKLVTMEKDTDGNVTVFSPNMAMINTLQTKISKGVYNKVDDQVISDLEIPIGNAIGGVLFSGQGPKFKVKILTIADVDTKFSDSIEPVGINHVRYKSYMDITVYVDIMIPGYKTDTVVVSDKVIVCDTTIVGNVPNVYADIGEG